MPDWIFQALSVAGGAVAVYAGIRADLARLHERVRTAAEAASAAHRRIDGMLIERRGMHG